MPGQNKININRKKPSKKNSTIQHTEESQSTAEGSSSTVQNIQDNESTTVEGTINSEHSEQYSLSTVEEGTGSTIQNSEDTKLISEDSETEIISTITSDTREDSDYYNEENNRIESNETQKNENEAKENVASTSDFGKKESIEEFCAKISNQSSNYSIMCRICYDDTLDEPIISPCKCKGSIGMMHKSCLEKWLAESNTNRCDLCFHKFETERTTKFSVYNSIYRWIRHPPTSFAFPIRDMRSDMVTCMVLIPFSVLLVYLCLFAAEYYNRQNFSMIPVARWTAISVMFMGIVITLGFCTWIYLVMRYHSRVWYFWWQRETIVRIHVKEVVDK